MMAMAQISVRMGYFVRQQNPILLISTFVCQTWALLLVCAIVDNNSTDEKTWLLMTTGGCPLKASFAALWSYPIYDIKHPPHWGQPIRHMELTFETAQLAFWTLKTSGNVFYGKPTDFPSSSCLCNIRYRPFFSLPTTFCVMFSFFKVIACITKSSSFLMNKVMIPRQSQAILNLILFNSVSLFYSMGKSREKLGRPYKFGSQADYF